MKQPTKAATVHASFRSVVASLTCTLCLGLALLCSYSPAIACTTAVISGRVTVDGRPILWKNRDYASSPRNELVHIDGGRYRVLAVVDAGSRSSVWMGVNEAGFCIENSLSTDLGVSGKTNGPSNGPFMKLALQSCASVEEFKQLLEKTNVSGRRTVANFGVIDSQGGAAIFETGPNSFRMFDANDPSIAPNGVVVRSNFSMTAKELPSLPKSEQLEGISSARRYLRACELINATVSKKLDVAYVLRNMTRDLAEDTNRPIDGTINSNNDRLPLLIETRETISRDSTVSAAVFHGVAVGEDPRNTTMWTILGDPKFSIAVPGWVGMTEVAGPMQEATGGEIGEIARTLRDWSLSHEKGRIYSAGLAGIWEDLWPLEGELLHTVTQQRNQWAVDGFEPAVATQLHEQLANQAMSAMTQELIEAKNIALTANSLSSERPAFETTDPIDVTRSKPLTIAIYDHSDGSANGPKNLMRILTKDVGFMCKRVRPEDIREGVLEDTNVLIVPGGSGSLQAEKLELEGREAVVEFVKRGGGYVGICAGSYLASSHYDWSLGLINARVWDRAHWARGTGEVVLSFTDNGLSALAVSDNKSVPVYYGQGPLLVPGYRNDLPAYEPLATYQTEISKKGAPKNAMVGTHAIIRSVLGNGRVVCYSPHPETQTGPNWLIIQGVRWAAGL